MTWNPVLKLVLDMKKEYISRFNDGSLVLEEWKEKLNDTKYNEFFDCLQINQKDEFVLIRYGLQEMQRGMWEDENSIYRECRSIVIDLKREQLVLTPYRKFFNLDEVEENKLDNIQKKFNTAKVVEISNKLDGSMQNARWYNNKVFMTGSMALSTEDSWRLQDGYNMLTENYINMIRENEDYTFIFEYISLQDAHVVLYNEEDEGLYLIGVRDTSNGYQFTYKQVTEIADKYGVPVVDIENKTLEQLLEEMKTVKSHEKEGWVLNLDGHYVKVKCDDYVSIHRLLDKVSSVNVIIENIAEERYDDLVSKIPDKYKERVQNIANLIFTYIKDNKEKIKNYYSKAPKTTRKDFMIWVDKNVEPHLKAYVRNEFLGIEYNLLKNGNRGYKRMSELGFNDKYSVLFASVKGE